MKLKSMMLLVLAAGCGLVAMFLFQQASSGKTQEEEKISVLVCIRELTPGEKLNDENVEFREYPTSMVPENAVLTKEEYEGLATVARTFPGDMITLDKLSDESAPSGDIPSGMVAIGIPVDSTMTSSGMLLPGDRVDVLVTFLMRSALGSGKTIKTVLEFVQVFATDSEREAVTGGGEKKTKTITLLVTPDEAMLVKLAEEVGRLHLAMRSKVDATRRVAEDEKFDPSSMTEFFSGGDSEEEEEADDSTDTDQDTDLDSFLDANSEPLPTEFGEFEPIAPPAIPTWEIEILAGDERRVEEVPLPVEEIEESNKPSNPVLDGLKRLFGGRDSGEKTKKSGSVQPGLVEPATVN